MNVIKRDNTIQGVDFNKITNRIKTIINEQNLTIDPIIIAQKVCTSISNNIKTTELDKLTAEIAISLATLNPEYNILASAITISDLHKNLRNISFSSTILGSPHVSHDIKVFVDKHSVVFDKKVNYNLDYDFDYFALKTLEKAYLLKDKFGNITERPQDLFMRVSLGIHFFKGTESTNDQDQTIISNTFETYDLMSSKKFIHATPTLFNAGSHKPQLASCFLQDIGDDSVTSIYKTLSDSAQISKYAGGIGLHIHNIRSTGSSINNIPNSCRGIVPMLKTFNETAKYICQSGKRNGSIAIYLQVDHPDIFQFLDLKKNSGDEEDRARDLFYALWIPDLFMERVKENGLWSLFCPHTAPRLSDVYGDEYVKLYTKYESEKRYTKQIKAQELWFAICTAQIETGTPYMLYKDSINKKSNQKNVGTIKSSNLCVAPDTMILTEDGYFPIKELKDKTTKIWNGTEFSETTIYKTGENQKLLTIKTNNGMDLKCTEYHKFHIETGSRPADKSITKIIDAKDLKPNMNIIRYNLPILKNNVQTMKYAYTHGLFCADGTYNKVKNSKYSQCLSKQVCNNLCMRHQNCKKEFNSIDKCSATTKQDKPLLFLYGEKQNLIKHIDFINNITNSNNRLNVQLPKDIHYKYFVPINFSIQTKLDWLAGYCDGDGCVIRNNGLVNIQVSSINKKFLTNILYLLQTLGIQSNVVKSQNKRQVKLPNGKGGLKYYSCRELYRLNIDSTSIHKLCSLGFKPHRLDISENRLPHHITNRFIKITDIIDNNEYGDTYCFNEPKEHKGIFNGLLTGNCTEIVQYTSKEETAVCNLASICLPQFIKGESTNVKEFDYNELRNVAKVITRNLNKVIDLNYYPIPEAERSNKRHRPIGIGVQGLADVYIILRHPFDSEEAHKINKKIFETIYLGAAEASMELAKQYGPYETFKDSPISKGIFQFDLWNLDHNELNYKEDWKKLKEDIQQHGIYNSLLLAPMPTASTSQIMGNNECIEPYTSNIYLRRTIAGEFVVINKHLVKDLQNINMWSKEMKDNIIRHNGSIQNIPNIPQSIKSLYKTAWEISQKVLINQSADRSPFICQSQSLNLFMAKPEMKKLSAMHFYAWSKGLKTGMYYLRTQPASNPIQFTISNQEVCESCSA